LFVVCVCSLLLLYMLMSTGYVRLVLLFTLYFVYSSPCIWLLIFVFVWSGNLYNLAPSHLTVPIQVNSSMRTINTHEDFS
jgi:hypothetical protein